MKQVLHIFAKDARHLWVEILFSVTATAVFAWLYPTDWLTAKEMYDPARSGLSDPVQVVVGILTVLIPGSWWLLISNLIHDDRLVGDRQFWLTRPYEWKKLLAAKLLFLLAFLYLPLFLAQCALLDAAGFSPLSYLPELLFNLLLISSALVLPLLALATVTSNLARMTLALLGALLALGIISALAYRINLEINLEWMILQREMGVFRPLFVLCLCAAAVVSQYATRRTRVSVLLLMLLAFPVAYLPVGEFITHSHALVDRVYPSPVSGADAPVRIAFDSSAVVPPLIFVPRRSRAVDIEIHLDISGIADRSVIIPDAVRATVEAPGGIRWDSDWQLISMTKLKLLSTQKEGSVGFTMPLAVYDRLKSMPLTMHLALALTQSRAGRVTSISLPAGSFSVPDFGICSPQKDLNDPDEARGIFCLSALREPQLTQIQLVAHNASSTCASAKMDAGVANSTWQGLLEADSAAELGIASVKFPFGAWPYEVDPTGRGRITLHLCRGAPITFTRYDLVDRAQVAITVPGFQLPILTPGERQIITNP